MVRKYSLCFVDDDEHELKRFKAAFEGEFYVGIGTDLGKAEANLTENMPRRRFHFWRPRVHLYVLDMYFPIGTTNTPEQRAKLAKALGDCRKANQHLKAVLRGRFEIWLSGPTVRRAEPSPPSHRITFERLIAIDPAPRTASCIGGARARPPEVEQHAQLDGTTVRNNANT